MRILRGNANSAKPKETTNATIILTRRNAKIGYFPPAIVLMMEF
jgi:hypothetical protein